MEQDAKDFEQFGLVALVGLILVPGLAWIMRGATTGAVVRRTLFVGAIVAAAATVEMTIDRGVDELLEE